MRDTLNFDMLPIVQDISFIDHNSNGGGITNISSNCYYGYQPPSLIVTKETDVRGENDGIMMMEVVQFENYPQPVPQQNNHSLVNRKRGWDFSNDFTQIKKRRHNECNPSTHQHQSTSTASNKDLPLRKPTHNIPDMPRCILGHYM